MRKAAEPLSRGTARPETLQVLRLASSLSTQNHYTKTITHNKTMDIISRGWIR